MTGMRRRATIALTALSLVLASVVPFSSSAAAGEPAPPAPETPWWGDGTEAVVVQSGDLELAFFPCKGNSAQTYKVPSDTRSVYVEAVGGQGETPDPHETGWGGLGAQVTGSLSVQPGQELSVQVGCGGDSDGGDSPYAPGGARGVGHNQQQFAMSSYGISGGGGGGASAVLIDDGPPLVVAGGGGGAAGDATNCEVVTYSNPNLPPPHHPAYWYVCGPPVEHDGGDGGAGGEPAGAGGVGDGNPSPAAGGGCGTSTSGQPGQSFDVLGAGGAGGGGGGGYRGGCGGAAAPETHIPEIPGGLEGIGGNGGGAGSSFADLHLVGNPGFATSDNSGDGYVVFVTGSDTLRTFEYGPSQHVASLCMPAGTDRLFVDALGGAGGGGGSGYHGIGTGGSGSHVLAVVPTTPGTEVGVKVGEFGGGGGGWGDGHGGNHGTAQSEGANTGGGGGGSSAVKATTVACTAQSPPLTDSQYDGGSYLVVAGGGGGGGGNGGVVNVTDGGDGGHGGNPPGDGGDGSNSPGLSGSPGGCGGAAPGQPPLPGGDCEGTSGSIAGDDGTGSALGGGGGGGGAGYLGGGKGHGAAGALLAGGGGGGGGRSYAEAVDPTQVAYAEGADGGSNADGHVSLIVPFPAKRDEVAILGGNQQSAFPGQQFAHPLEVQALDADGFPIPDAPITFLAPPESLGAPRPAIVFPGGSMVSYSTTTDAQGKASVAVTAATPPWTSGAVPVTAMVTGAEGTNVKPAEFSLVNSPLPTVTTLTSSTPGNQSNPEQAVTFTAAVATHPPNPYDPSSPDPSHFGIPTGDLQFSIDGTVVATAPVDAAGEASTTVNGLAAGVHAVTATYLGDDEQIFAASHVVLQQASNMAFVSIALASSHPTAGAGDPIQFTSTVSPPEDLEHLTPTGNVQYRVDGVAVGGPVPLVEGVATSAPVTDLAVGLHTVSVLYLGDTGFLSAFQTLGQLVQAESSTTLTTDTFPRTFTAKVVSASPGVTEIPQGTVAFRNASDTTTPLLATVPLDATGTATTPTVDLCCYFNDIIATYSGEDRFAGSEATMTAYDLLGPAPDPPPDHVDDVRRAIRRFIRRLLRALGR